MEGARSSIIAALLFLTLVVLAAAASGGGDDAAVEEEKRHPLADEPYLLVTFKNKDGEEIRLVADKWSDSLSACGFANRSGNWFYAIREREGSKRGGGGRRLPHVTSRGTAEGLWNTLGALASTATASGGPAASAAAAADGERYVLVGMETSGGPAAAAAAAADGERYVLVGMETSGGHKIRLVAIADQRYASITGFAQGFSNHLRWSFRDGERHRLLPTFGNGSSHGSSHAEVVASNLLAALLKAGSSRV